MSAVRIVGGWAVHVVAWAVILLAVAVLAVAVLVPRVTGATPYTILTASMRPQLPPGTLVVVRPVRPERLGVGDVVTYQLRSGEPEVVTHRIRQVDVGLDGSLSFQTQGDANDSPDRDRVLPAQVRGRVWYAVPLLGRLNTLMTGRQHQVAVDGAAAVLIGYALVMFAGSLRDRRRGRRSAAREEASA